jgi:hypothetical protein
MRSDRAGAWFDLPAHNADIELDAFVVMPDHVHGIVVLLSPGHGGMTPGGPEPNRPEDEREIAAHVRQVGSVRRP